ncbi:hypothetical protein CLV24_13011 [Pontibacter ummariensis]|uniref:Lipocalin-like domain-containing protein n=1 Tax=Pontibacter ummariensis TaxID=1610492 RepID=A0A239KP76_9BACT|nr:hypothetical protein [Pontibacter ummariensis]PRY05331.1 hypothetical protein CLV24_13011 [Pontibacter ummariensis]SNT19359.1 hypothetical protein SAMN06296052_13011 [Pontibacter ummariensis]
MKKIYTFAFVLLLISCSVKEIENESIDQHQNNTSSPTIESQNSGTQVQFTKEDIKGVWTSGETENASFNIEEDSILFVDAFEYIKYEFRNDTLIYIEDNVPFFKTRVIKADKDSLVISNQDGIRRLWRFKD